MAKRRLTPKQFRNETIRRQIQITRYATGQANYAQYLINKMNEEIARFCLKKEVIETKGQYADCKRFIKAQCIEYREKLYNYLQNELNAFIKEQAKWLYINSPIKLEKANNEKIARDVFFSAFSDTDNIKTYITRIFDQVFQIWNAQIKIAYRTGHTMKNMVLLILNKDFK